MLVEKPREKRTFAERKSFSRVSIAAADSMLGKHSWQFSNIAGPLTGREVSLITVGSGETSEGVLHAKNVCRSMLPRY